MAKYVGKVALLRNYAFYNSGSRSNLNGYHYVLIRKYEPKNKEVRVQVITSLEDGSGNYNFKKLREVRSGRLIPIPINNTNLSRWSALQGHTISRHVRLHRKLNINDLENLDCKKIKRSFFKLIKRRR